MKKLINVGYGLIYFGLALLHFFLISQNFFMICLIFLLEFTRLIAFLTKAKLIICVLAIFSCVSIVSNYNNMYEKEQQNAKVNKDYIANISAYTSKYWVSQEKYLELLKLSQNKQNEIQQLPNVLIVALLIILIEGCLAYMFINNNISRQEKLNIPKKVQDNIKNDSNPIIPATTFMSRNSNKQGNKQINQGTIILLKKKVINIILETKKYLKVIIIS